MTSKMIHFTSLRQGVRGLALALVLTALTAVSAPAQDVQRIAAVVNDEAVSFFDLFERVKLVVITSGLEGSPEEVRRLTPQVLKALIDEHLRLQEGERRNIAVSEDEINQAIGAIEQSNQMPPGAFMKFLEERRISVETLKTRLRSELVWSKLVNRRLLRTVTINDEDIDNELDQLRKNFGKPEYLISEIFISVDSPSDNKRVRDDATELARQLRGGADFDAMVNQFSEGVTANQGGGVGWVNAEQLSPNVVTALKTLEEGEISDPIVFGGGYMIIKLRDRRQLRGADPDDVEINLRQILLTLPPDSPQEDIDSTMALATVIRETVDGCDDMASIAAEIDPSLPGDLGMMKLKDAPDHIRAVLSGLPLETISEPVRSERGDVLLLMICEMIEPDINLPDRDQIRNSLLVKQLNRVARQYLRDLRRDAFVDIRI